MPGMNRSTIINSALRRLGGVDTNIPTGGTNPANSQAEAAYTSVVRRVLSAYDWGFATRYRELAEVADPPLFGFTKAYQLPSDTVRLVSVHAGMRDDEGDTHVWLHHPEPSHARSGRIIYCSVPRLFAQVVETGHEEGAHEPFLDACAYALAIEIAPAVAHGGIDVKITSRVFRTFFLRLARSSSPLPEIRPSWEAFAHPRSGCLLWFLVTKNSVHS